MTQVSEGRRRYKCDQCGKIDCWKKGWIPVTERLPETREPVLVTYRWGNRETFVTQTIYDGEYYGWMNYTYRSPLIVLAWSPLPEPYKEGE